MADKWKHGYNKLREHDEEVFVYKCVSKTEKVRKKGKSASKKKNGTDLDKEWQKGKMERTRVK